MRRREDRAIGYWVRSLSAVTALLVVALHDFARADSTPAAAADAVARRLTPDQYRNVIADLFGSDIKLGGRFEPGIRVNGLLAVGTGRVGMTATGLEQYDAMARTVAEQIVDEQHRATLLPCAPASVEAPDESCARQAIARIGRMLYRRPLTDDELRVRTGAAGSAAQTLKDFYSGLGLALAGMLESPQFLFRREVAEPDPDRPGDDRLDTYSKASQLSFFLWNTSPDAQLLAAAESGELGTEKGLKHQVDRMLESRRLEQGVRAFFIDMLQFDEFQTLSKDTTLFPKFTPQVAVDAREQTLRTITELLLKEKGDYRDLFTTRKTFLTPVLGSIYRVPLPKTTPNGAPDDWTAYEYPDGDPRAGIQAQVSFVALHSHPGRSSPTLRGKAVREILLCQKVPDPPGNVNFTVVQDTSNPQYRTAKERLIAHRTDPTCAGCHKLIDPVGFPMENFDSSGGYRTTENGAPIDGGGELDGMLFADTAGLGKALHDDPATVSCIVSRIYSYGVGRPPSKGEADWMKSLAQQFAADGYRFPDLLRRIATSDVFYRVAAPRTGQVDAPQPIMASERSGGGAR